MRRTANKALCIAALMIFAFSSYDCTENKTEIKNNAYNSSNSLNWQGAYAGILPCADCRGVETRLTLNADLSYILETKYLGKSEEVFRDSGSFVWDEAGRKIILKTEDAYPNKYRVIENYLIQLDREGNRITGQLEELYYLKKIDK